MFEFDISQKIIQMCGDSIIKHLFQYGHKVVFAASLQSSAAAHVFYE